MKKLIYIACIMGLAACNTNPEKKNESNTTTESGLAAPAANGALNPAHGAPGHRCDIAVGEPLSSAPAQGTQSLPQPTPNMPAAPMPTASENGPKLNPEHGLPGHDCKLPVGAPLT